ncbi:PDR/VanB family oxidoreductase [Neptunomonas marina]|uniref:Oxidoreductase n=1 Tax=Neptunomonas marina TaxID=1815562 RepID=A0A437QDQ2_9GAMM|nr:PDR/VanB family oxidoreductase [Neptunomonas marina]RVU32523.1 oxidoreductase [Neptunomonas marina]
MSHKKVAVEVSRIEQLTPTIKLFEFTPIGAEPLPPFSAGSHITVDMSDELSRSYSLINAPMSPKTYEIAVLLDVQSKGGSAYMHSGITVGTQLTVSEAANFFPLAQEQDSKHILIAGGIGITPFMSYLYELELLGADFELHYCFRDAANAAFIDELKARIGDKLFTYEQSADQRLDVAGLIAKNAGNSHVYVCGPQPLIDDVVANGNNVLGEERTHYELFGEAQSSGGAFEVHFQRSGFSLDVGENMSILQAIEADSRIKVECLCRNGVCGTCETTILEGEADHRDSYLDDEEQEAQETMMVCVSRAKGKRIVLDL